MTPIDATLRRWGGMSLVAGGIGLVATAAGFYFEPHGFFRSYLWAVLFAIGLSMGSACLAMIHHLSGGRWGFLLRRTFEAGMAPMGWMALLFIPIFFGLGVLYPWSDPAAVAKDAVLAHRYPYMSGSGFMIRSVVYLAAWIGIAWWLRTLSARQMATTDPEPTWQLRRFSAPALVAYALLATLAMLDWVISLDAHWYSSLFPALVCVGQLISGYALALLFLPAWNRAEPFGRLVNERVLNQIGNLLLAFTILWMYLAFSQFLIIWSGNLPQEAHWYLQRAKGGWLWLIVAVVVFHFVVPFAILLSREAKRRSGMLRATAAILFLAQLAYEFWVILPSAAERGIELTGWEWVALLGVGGIWFWAFAGALRARPLLGFNDPRFTDG